MTIEARTNYLGIFTTQPKEVAPRQAKTLVSWDSENLLEGNTTTLLVINPNMVAIKKEAFNGFHVTDRSLRILHYDEINRQRIETERDFLGRKMTFSWKDAHSPEPPPRKNVPATTLLFQKLTTLLRSE